MVSAESTPGFLLTMEEFLKTQPTEHIATVDHGLRTFPKAVLHPTHYAFGIGGYGDCGYGGSMGPGIRVNLQPIDWNTSKVFAIPQYAGAYAVNRLTENTFALFTPDSTTTLTLILR